MNKPSARRVALDILARVEDDGAYANLAASAALGRSDLDERDRRLVTDLVYGTVRRRRALDHLADRFLVTPPPPSARRALRLGTYQLVERPDIPDHAAVDETVAATPKRFKALVNAVLRKVAAAEVDYPDTPTRLSYPDWIVDTLRNDLGDDEALGALASMNEPAARIERADGYVQDPASQAVVDLVGARPGELVVDLCAAPGGKATGMAAGGATIIAVDLAAARVGLVVDNAARLGATNVLAVLADGSRPPLRRACADRVLVDAPCSGLGVLRRRADARWRIDEAAPSRLARVQIDLLDAAVDVLAPGGLLVYSVCTLTAAESVAVDAELAERHPGLIPEPAPGDPWIARGRGAVLLPQQVGSDGMWVFRYRLDPAAAPARNRYDRDHPTSGATR